MEFDSLRNRVHEDAKHPCVVVICTTYFSEGLYGPFRAVALFTRLGLLECGKGDVEFRSRCLPLVSPRMARFAVGASRLRVGAPFLRPPPPQYVVLLLGILHLPLSGRWLKQMAMSVATFLSKL